MKYLIFFRLLFIKLLALHLNLFHVRLLLSFYSLLQPLSILCRSFRDIDTYTTGFPRGNGQGRTNIFRAVKHCLPGPVSETSYYIVSSVGLYLSMSMLHYFESLDLHPVERNFIAYLFDLSRKKINICPML